MALYMIGYDIHPSKGETYGELIDAIKGLSGTWWHHLDSTWLVVHPGPASAILDALKPHLVKPNEEGGDEMLVARLTGETAWTTSFPQSGQDWIRNNYNK
jgi:hypothetical protein